MFENISVFHFLIYAAALGFAVAIIFTNIQRTSLSKFILFLVSNNCLSEETSARLCDMNLSALEMKYIKSAVNKQFGLKRSIRVVVCAAQSDEQASDVLFSDKCNDKYYITTADTQELIKKYSFKPLSAHLIVLFIAALAAVVIIMTMAVDWLLGFISKPTIDQNDVRDKIETEEMIDNTQSEDIPSTDNSKNDESHSDIAESETDAPNGPRIPV